MSRHLLTLLDDSANYQAKILNLFAGSIVGYWPLNETSDTTAHDVSDQGANGTYSNCVLGQPGVGGLSAQFDGSSSSVTLPAASLNGQLFSLMCFAKVLNAGVWSDGANRNALQFFVDGNNNAAIYKDSGGQQVQAVYVAGAVSKFAVPPASQPSGFFHAALTVGAGNFICYTSGNPSSPVTGLGTFSGAITQFLAGVSSWKGYLCQVVALSRVATPSEILAASRP